MRLLRMLFGGSSSYEGKAPRYSTTTTALCSPSTVSFLIHTHVHSPLAKAMNAALLPARVNDKFQDPLYLFLELVRAGVMHGNLWTGRGYSGGPSFGAGVY